MNCGNCGRGKTRHQHRIISPGTCELTRKIQCREGPCDRQYVSADLGARWCAAPFFDGEKGLLGYYNLVGKGEYQVYMWDATSIEEFSVGRRMDRDP